MTAVMWYFGMLPSQQHASGAMEAQLQQMREAALARRQQAAQEQQEAAAAAAAAEGARGGHAEL